MNDPKIGMIWDLKKSDINTEIHSILDSLLL